MRFIAERDSLLSALSFVTRYGETNHNIPILNTVKFDAGERGVSVTATDLDRAALDSFSAHVDRQGATCLSGHLLFKAVKSTDASEVQIDAGEKEAAIQIGGRTKMKLPVLPAGDFPSPSSLVNETACNFSLPAEVLKRHRSEIAFAESSEQGDGIWTMGTCWEIDGKFLHLVATNRRMLSRVTVPAPVLEMPRIIVPAVDLPEWSEDIHVSFSESFARFASGRQIVSTKLIDAQFPDYQRLIPDNQMSLRFDRDELFAAVNRMALVAHKFGVVILIVGRDGKAFLSAQSDGREITDEVAYEGEDFQICVAHKYLAPVLDSFKSEIIEWRVKDHGTGVTLHNPMDDSRYGVVWPISDHRIAQYLPQNLEAAE